MRITFGEGLKTKLAGWSGRRKAAAGAVRLDSRELEFLPAALGIVETPPSPIGRAIVWLLIALFTIAVLWSCFGQVDEVAVAQGKVIPSGYTKTIQAYDTGVVKSIHVQDGSKVQAGDVLVELDTTMTAADLARQSKERAFYQLEINRRNIRPSWPWPGRRWTRRRRRWKRRRQPGKNWRCSWRLPWTGKIE